MPYYKFLNKKTNEEMDVFMSISERDKFLQENPNVEQLVNGAPAIGYSTLTKKPDSGFRDVLSEIKKKHRGSAINTF
jgi:hypothetical protein